MDEDQHRGGDEPGEGYEWEEEPDLTSVSKGAELVRRGGASLSPQELARILMDGEGRSGEAF